LKKLLRANRARHDAVREPGHTLLRNAPARMPVSRVVPSRK